MSALIRIASSMSASLSISKFSFSWSSKALPAIAFRNSCWRLQFASCNRSISASFSDSRRSAAASRVSADSRSCWRRWFADAAACMYSSFARLAVDGLRAPNFLDSTGTLDMLDDDCWSDSAPAGDSGTSTGGCGATGRCSKVWFRNLQRVPESSPPP